MFGLKSAKLLAKLLFLCAVAMVSAASAAEGDDAGAGKRVWAEDELATVSTGIQMSPPRTLLTTYVIAAVGPVSIESHAENYAKGCLTVGLAAARKAFDSATGTTANPAAGATAGWKAFKLSVGACFSTNTYLVNLRDSFNPAIIERKQWKDGLSIDFSMESAQARRMKELRDLVLKETNLGGDGAQLLNKVAELSMDAQSIDVHVSISPDSVGIVQAGKYLSELPANSEELVANLKNEATKAGNAVESVAVATMKGVTAVAQAAGATGAVVTAGATAVVASGEAVATGATQAATTIVTAAVGVVKDVVPEVKIDLPPCCEIKNPF